MSKERRAVMCLPMFVGAIVFGATLCTPIVDVFAEDSDSFNESLQARLVGADGLPDNTELIVRSGFEGIESEEDAINLLYGEGGFEKMSAWEDEMEHSESKPREGTEEYYQMFALFYDSLGIIPADDDDYVLDIHLANIDSGEKVEYAGDGITIRYDFGIRDSDVYESEFAEILKRSEKNWQLVVVHVKSDGSREYLPATITDGVWEFTAKDFSVFYPALVADIGEEAPSTLDNTYVNIGVAFMGATGLFVLGAWLAKKERR